jgi:YfiR/HmsC-like
MGVLATPSLPPVDCHERKRRRRIFVASLAALAFHFASRPAGQLLANDIPLEYQVKAVYLFNFAKFVEWPAEAQSGPLTICVAATNPFGDVLEETLRGETVNDRPLASRIIPAPEPGCHVIFVPQAAAIGPYLRAASGSPTLTVGETRDFLSHGGIINFILEAGRVRFQIDAKAAERADLRISSHLLRLARGPQPRG